MELRVIGSKMLRYGPRVRSLVELLLVKPDRECLDWPICRCLHECDDCRRIDSTREKRSERNVRLHPQPHSISKKRFELGDRIPITAIELRHLTMTVRLFSRSE